MAVCSGSQSEAGVYRCLWLGTIFRQPYSLSVSWVIVPVSVLVCTSIGCFGVRSMFLVLYCSCLLNMYQNYHAAFWSSSLSPQENRNTQVHFGVYYNNPWMDTKFHLELMVTGVSSGSGSQGRPVSDGAEVNFCRYNTLFSLCSKHRTSKKLQTILRQSDKPLKLISKL